MADASTESAEESGKEASSEITILFVADCVGQPGRHALSQIVNVASKEWQHDLIDAGISEAREHVTVVATPW